MQKIDLLSWERRDIYAFYRETEQPHVGVTVPLDVTALIARSKRDQLPLFGLTLHALCRAVNTVPELRQRIRVEQGVDVVVCHEQIRPGFTVAAPGGRFNFASVPMTADLTLFLATVASASKDKALGGPLTPFDATSDEFVYFSCLPWLHFTALTSPKRDADDATPRVCWGQAKEQSGRWTLPISLEAHHALVDGRHLAAFFEAAQAFLDEA